MSAACRRCRSGRNKPTARRRCRTRAASGRGEELGEQRHGHERSAHASHPALQVVLGHHEQRHADDRPIDRPEPADHGHQQDVEHHVEADRRLRPDVAQPEGHQDPGAGGQRGGQAVHRDAIEQRAVSDGFGAKLVLADRFEHAAEARVDHAQHQQEQQCRGEEDQVVGQNLAIDGGAEDLGLEDAEAGRQRLRQAEGAAIVSSGQTAHARDQRAEGRGDGQRHHRVEDRLHAQGDQGNDERQDQRDCQPRHGADQHRAPGRPQLVHGDRDAVRADAVEHRMREGHDAAIPQQQIEGSDQHQEHADRRSHVERARPRKEEGRGRKVSHDEHQQRAQQPAARQVARKELIEHGVLG